MTHEDAGHYAAKHPDETSDPVIATAITAKAEGGSITCAAAFSLLDTLEVSPTAIGRTADLLEVRITRCQLGLFGYKPEKKIVKPADEVAEELRQQLDRAAVEGSITCASGWEIAQALGIAKMAVAAACERLGLRIIQCQLGAF
jgi:hypothetical protein